MALNVISNAAPAVKICGITKIDQAIEIASLGADAIGVIGVKQSPRFLSDTARRELFNELTLKAPHIERVWVVADIDDKEILDGIRGYGAPTVVQLHGKESSQRCKELKKKFAAIKWWKAIRIQTQDDLVLVNNLESSVDAILLDAWNQNVIGGTGKRLPVEWLKKKDFSIPWWLAGGVSADWIGSALKEIKPTGVDASSKLEISPGVKDIKRVKSLINEVKNRKN